jgi:hypothetical protein
MSRVLAEKSEQNNMKKPIHLKKTKSKLTSDVNLLDMVPVRNCKWSRQKTDKNRIRILKSRFDSGLGKRIGNKFKVKDTVNVNLDDYGTAVWRLCDGILTVREIGEILKTQFAEDVEPLYPRLGGFIRTLKANNFIELESPKKAKKVKKMKNDIRI